MGVDEKGELKSDVIEDVEWKGSACWTTALWYRIALPFDEEADLRLGMSGETDAQREA